jgi:hypothetical protein
MRWTTPTGPFVENAQRAIRGKRFRCQDLERVAAEVWASSMRSRPSNWPATGSQFADPVTEVFASLMNHVAVGLGGAPQRDGRSIAAAIASTRG